MSYSTNPVRDAETYWDRQFAEADRLEKARIAAAQQIREAFENEQPVPYVTTVGFGGAAKVRYMPWEEAVGDVLNYPEVDKAFMEVLRTSDCPKVKALLKAMADRHVDMNADELGELL